MAGENTVLEESILNSIKHLLGITADNTVFDGDIAIHINTVLANLVSMGVGPENGFSIHGANETWADFIGNEKPLLIENVKSYVYIKVRLIFDPPVNTSVINAFENQAKELEYRMYTARGGY